MSVNESYPPDSAKQEDKDAAEAERHKSIQAAVNLIAGEISLALWGIDPAHQNEADTAVL